MYASGIKVFSFMYFVVCSQDTYRNQRSVSGYILGLAMACLLFVSRLYQWALRFYVRLPCFINLSRVSRLECRVRLRQAPHSRRLFDCAYLDCPGHNFLICPLKSLWEFSWNKLIKVQSHNGVCSYTRKQWYTMGICRICFEHADICLCTLCYTRTKLIFWTCSKFITYASV